MRRRGRGYGGYGGGYGVYRRRRRGTKIGIILGAVLGVLLLIAVILSAVRISEIEVSGNKQYTKEQVIDLIFDGSGPGIRPSVTTRTGSGNTSPFRSLRNIKSNSRVPQRWKSWYSKKAWSAMCLT